MAREIQTYPVGLLSELTLKGGLQPYELSDVVVPVIELGPHYAASNYQSSESIATLQSLVANGPTLTVPSGEAWRVLAIMGGLSVPSAVGTIMAARVQIIPFGGQGVDVCQIPSYTSVAASDVNTNGILVPQPFIAGPGFAFSCALTRPCGGANTVTVSVRVAYTPLRV